MKYKGSIIWSGLSEQKRAIVYWMIYRSLRSVGIRTSDEEEIVEDGKE